jgi:hypothetical protein
VAAITRADIKAAVASWKEEGEKEPLDKGKEASPEKESRRGERKRKAGEGIRTIPAALRTLRAILA